MSKSIEQQAADVAAMAFSGQQWPIDDIIASLSRAGLLVSERDVLCREYVAAHLAYMGSADHERRFRSAEEAIRAYDREHAPKPRYRVVARTVPSGPNNEFSHDVCDSNRAVFPGTEAECTVVAAALNALAEKEAGR